MLPAGIALVRLFTVDVVSRSYRDYVKLLSLPNLICLFSEALSLIIRYVFLTELSQPYCLRTGTLLSNWYPCPRRLEYSRQWILGTVLNAYFLWKRL